MKGDYMNKNHKILCLDGHDGSGKTTLAIKLAKKLDAQYLKPFDSTAGKLMIWSAKNDNQAFTIELAKNQIDWAFSKISSNTIVMDRCWLTLFTLFSPELRKLWKFRPTTVLCYADLECTCKRLSNREAEKQESISYHSFYLKLYRDLAAQFNCPILRTDKLNIQQCMKSLLDIFTERLLID